MKIAAVYNNNNCKICSKFDDARVLKVYEIENGEIINTEMVGTMAECVEDIIGLIMLLEVDCVLCNYISRAAMALMDNEGILFYNGFDGDADYAVDAFISGSITFVPDE